MSKRTLRGDTKGVQSLRHDRHQTCRHKGQGIRQRYPDLKKYEKGQFLKLIEFEKIAEAHNAFVRNEWKYEKTNKRHGDDLGYRDSETELFQKDLDMNPVETICQYQCSGNRPHRT